MVTYTGVHSGDPYSLYRDGRDVSRFNVPESGTSDAAKAPNGKQWWQFASPGKRKSESENPAAEATNVAAVEETKALAKKLRPNFKCDR